MSQWHKGHEDGVADRRDGKAHANTELMLNAGERNGYRAGWADEDLRQNTEPAGREQGR